MEHNYSDKWKKRGDRTGLLRNALLKSMGYTDKDIEKPIIGIINTWAETNPGHVHFRQFTYVFHNEPKVSGIVKKESNYYKVPLKRDYLPFLFLRQQSTELLYIS